MKHGLLFLLLLIAENAFALYGSKVQEANEGYVVALYLNDSNHPEKSFFCNGVLISPTKVLTAGHCIDGMGLDVYDMSQALVYKPSRIQIQVGGKMIKAKAVTFSDSYFESAGHEASDLALIELSSAVTNISPVRIANKGLLTNGRKLTLIARGSKVETKLIQTKNYAQNSILFLDKEAGACAGDSGGAIVVNEKGQQLLAGILMYDGGKTCYKKTGYGQFPRARF